MFLMTFQQILYADGDVETLQLKKERWELITDPVSPDAVSTSLYAYFFSIVVTHIYHRFNLCFLIFCCQEQRIKLQQPDATASFT